MTALEDPSKSRLVSVTMPIARSPLGRLLLLQVAVADSFPGRADNEMAGVDMLVCVCMCGWVWRVWRCWW